MAKTNKATSEEIIEKKESNPLGTASLILSSLAMIGAIVFGVAEIMEYRTDLNQAEASDANPARMIVKRDTSNFRGEVEQILGGTAAGFGDDDDDDDSELGDDDDDAELGDDDDDAEFGDDDDDAELGDDDDDAEFGDDDDDDDAEFGDDDDDIGLGDDDDDF